MFRTARNKGRVLRDGALSFARTRAPLARWPAALLPPFSMKYRFFLLLLPLLALAACDSNDEPDAEIVTEDLVVGVGPEAAEGYFVQFRYAGKLENGTDIGTDSLEVALGDGSLIEGLDRGLRGMREGGRRRITVPPSLAFGRRGTEDIPPNSTLVFDVTMKRVGASNGIYIQELQAGTGDEAARSNLATVAYVGSLMDGTVFDQGSFSFTIDGGGVIEGFNRGVKGMKTGGKRLIIIPPSLGYGSRQTGSIPPFSTLVFEVTLTRVAK